MTFIYNCQFTNFSNLQPKCIVVKCKFYASDKHFLTLKWPKIKHYVRGSCKISNAYYVKMNHFFKFGYTSQDFTTAYSFTLILLPYHWHYFATAAFITDQLKVSFLCAVECFLAKKEIETFAEVAVHFPRSWLMGTV